MEGDRREVQADKGMKADKELSDEQLDQVAGGKISLILGRLYAWLGGSGGSDGGGSGGGGVRG